jgi:hypothetical protein
MALIITHPPNPEYSEGWDRIFGKKKDVPLAYRLKSCPQCGVATTRALCHNCTNPVEVIRYVE